MLSVKQGGITYHFKVFGMTRPRIESRFPGPLANTLPIFANDAGDRGSTTGRVIPKIQHYKVRIKSKMDQSREWSSVFPYTSVK